MVSVAENALVLQFGMWVATATLQIPIEVALSTTGRDLALLGRLAATNVWSRRIPMLVNSGLFVWMALRVLSDAPRGREDRRA